jgi:AcrR family transcriptional regulator
MTGIANAGPGSEDLGDPILNAALAELVHPTTAAFSEQQVAARAGVDVREIRRHWPNTRELLGATLEAYFDGRLPVPDTGSLRGDLRVFACWLASVYNTSLGRRLLDALMSRPSDWDVSGARRALLDVRAKRYQVLFRRGIERGECDADIDVERLLDLIAIGTALPVVFHDRPVTDDDAHFVIDTILDGVGRDRRE